MFDLKLNSDEFVFVATSILTRIDFITDILRSPDLAKIVREHYVEELSSLRVLYDKLTSRE